MKLLTKGLSKMRPLRVVLCVSSFILLGLVSCLKQESHKLKSIPYEVTSQRGVRIDIYVDQKYRNDSCLHILGYQIKQDFVLLGMSTVEGHAVVNVYDNRDAAKLELNYMKISDSEASFCDKHMIAQYSKYPRSGEYENSFTYSLLNGVLLDKAPTILKYN